MSDEQFEYDPEAGEDTKKLRLPFALCKAHGIPIQDWWTPKDAWQALKNGGVVENVSEEYAEFYRQKKKKQAEEYRKSEYGKYRAKAARLRQKRKKEQLLDKNHNPLRDYEHQDGTIASANQGLPMDFKQANSGNCNPYYGQGYIGYKTNCATCVATYIARRQGYDIRALPNLNNEYVFALSTNVKLAYDGNIPTRNCGYGERKKKFLAENVKPNRIYGLQMHWVGGQGHIICAERDDNGFVRLYDPQTNQIWDDETQSRNFKKVKSMKLFDFTDCKMNESMCDKIMLPRRKL